MTYSPVDNLCSYVGHYSADVPKVLIHSKSPYEVSLNNSISLAPYPKPDVYAMPITPPSSVANISVMVLVPASGNKLIHSKSPFDCSFTIMASEKFGAPKPQVHPPI